MITVTLTTLQTVTDTAYAVNASSQCPDGYTTVPTSMTYFLDYTNEVEQNVTEAEIVSRFKWRAPSCNIENPEPVCWPQAAQQSVEYQDHSGTYTLGDCYL